MNNNTEIDAEHGAIFAKKTKKSFLPFQKSDFKTKKSNEIISELVKEIDECTSAYDRSLNITYSHVEGRIIEVELHSKDGIIEGHIIYNPSEMNMNIASIFAPEYARPVISNSNIIADFYFNSNKKEDVKEFKELVEIINKNLR